MPADPSAGDGLDELQAARLARQNRRPPAPKRPRARGPAHPVAGEQTAGEPSRVDTPPVETQAAAITAPASTPPPALRADAGAINEGPLTLVQVRVTEAQLDYLDEIDAVAATRRLDVTDAAVIRFALRQLMAAHTPDDLVERLGRPKVRGRRGRPRR